MNEMMNKKQKLLKKALWDILDNFTGQYEASDAITGHLADRLVMEKLGYIQSGGWAIQVTPITISVLSLPGDDFVSIGQHHTELSSLKSVRKYFEYIEKKSLAKQSKKHQKNPGREP